MRVIQSILLLTGLSVLAVTGVIHIARAATDTNYRLVFVADLMSEGPQIYASDLDGSHLEQISFNPTFESGWQTCPTPSPDGMWIATYSYYLEAQTLYALRTRWGTNVQEFSNIPISSTCGNLGWSKDKFVYTDYYSIDRVHPLYPNHTEVIIQSDHYTNAFPSPDGQWLLYPSSPNVTIFNTRGGKHLSFQGIPCLDADWSPNSRYAACKTSDENPSLFIFDTQTVTNNYLSAGSEPAWSPDSQWIAFWDDRQLFRIHPDGSGQELIYTLDEQFGREIYWDMTPIWSPDSTWMLLPSLCIVDEKTQISDCQTFRLTLADSSLTLIQPIFHATYQDGTTDEIPVTMLEPQFLPPLRNTLDTIPLFLGGALLLMAGMVRQVLIARRG